MDSAIPQEIRDSFPWAYSEPNPQEIIARMKEGARRVLSATTSPPGYGTAPERDDD